MGRLPAQSGSLARVSQRPRGGAAPQVASVAYAPSARSRLGEAVETRLWGSQVGRPMCASAAASVHGQHVRCATTRRGVAVLVSASQRHHANPRPYLRMGSPTATAALGGHWKRPKALVLPKAAFAHTVLAAATSCPYGLGSETWRAVESSCAALESTRGVALAPWKVPVQQMSSHDSALAQAETAQELVPLV